MPSLTATTSGAAPPPRVNNADDTTLLRRLLFFINPIDARYEDLRRGNIALNVLRDFAAGLIVAMVAIPLAMGFAMASGLRPEQGIVGGAIAGMIGALWGGSKYQVYGPTAAFIPVIGGLMAKYDHRVLVLASILAGVILIGFGVLRLGRIVAKVPHSIVVGFTIGIAITIAFSQVGELLGLKAKMGYSLFDKVAVISANLGAINYYAVAIGLFTFVITKYVLKISVFIPAPLLALGLSTLIAATLWGGKGLVLVKEKYGQIPTDFLVFTSPASIIPTPQFLLDLAYYVVAFVVVAAIESLLCSRMADRLADNRGTPFNPNKELWGQGIVQIVIPLVERFPAHRRTGAHRHQYQAWSGLAPGRNLQVHPEAAARALPCTFPRAGPDGVHRRHSALRFDRDGEASGSQAGSGSQLVPHRADGVYGGHGRGYGLPDRSCERRGDLGFFAALPRQAGGCSRAGRRGGLSRCSHTNE